MDKQVKVTEGDVRKLYDSWREVCAYPVGHGVFGPVATAYGLGPTTAMLMGWIHELMNDLDSTFIVIDGEQYVWANYSNFLELYPSCLTRISSRSHLSTTIRSLVKLGVLSKYNQHDFRTGHRVYLRIPQSVQNFLFREVKTLSSLETICREWLTYWDDAKVTALS